MNSRVAAVPPQELDPTKPSILDSAVFYSDVSGRQILSDGFSYMIEPHEQQALADSVDSIDKVNALFDVIRSGGGNPRLTPPGLIKEFITHRTWGEGPISDVDQHLIHESLATIQKTQAQVTSRFNEGVDRDSGPKIARQKIDLTKSAMAIAVTLADVDTKSSSDFMDIAKQDLGPLKEGESNWFVTGSSLESNKAIVLGEIQIAAKLADADRDPKLSRRYTADAVKRFGKILEAVSYNPARQNTFCREVIDAIKISKSHDSNTRPGYEILAYMAKQGLLNGYVFPENSEGRSSAIMVSMILKAHAPEEDLVMHSVADRLETLGNSPLPKKLVAKLGNLLTRSK